MDFLIEETGFNPEAIIQNGHTFMTGNGVCGYRGTLEEYSKEDHVALNLNNIYDGLDGKWRESVNTANPFFLTLSHEGKPLSPKSTPIRSHKQSLDLSSGVHTRQTVFLIGDTAVTLTAKRFISMHDKTLLATRVTISASDSLTLTLRTGFDTDIWEINGPHFKKTDKLKTFDGAIFQTTQEKKHTIRLIQQTTLQAAVFFDESGVFGKEKTVTIKKEAPFSFDKLVVLTVDEPPGATETRMKHASNAGYDKLENDHVKTFKDKWAVADVKIEGDLDAQKALRYSIYHLLILTPPKNTSIPARGLSGQVYKGAVFWDSEIFMLPFFLHTDKKAARNLLDYRIKTLPGARGKAKDYGYKGAFYAWESHEDGQDACSDFNVTDVFTNRPVRTYFRDKQIHISGDIAYAINRYFTITGDETVLLEGGAEVIFECARFFLSYLRSDLYGDTHEFLDVVGPDEYHERVHNNAFTNKLAFETFNMAVNIYEHLEKNHPATLEKLCHELAFEKDYAMLKIERHKVALQKPGPNHLIEQFDGYFDLEDISLAKLRERIVHPREYLGTASGVAYPTQVIKQADVVTMLCLFPEDYDDAVKETNYDYYKQRTEHGSSLSASMYGLLACAIGRPDEAYPYFMKSATADLKKSTKQYAGNIYIGGTHPAASGGAYLLAVYGFAGLSFEGNTIRLNPNLPKTIDRLTFKLHHDNRLKTITVTKETHHIDEGVTL